MAYEMVIPPTPPVHLRWFTPYRNEVTEDDLVEITLQDDERLYFRYGTVDSEIPEYDAQWYLDPDLLPDVMKTFLPAKGNWRFSSRGFEKAQIGGYIEMEHTRSQYQGNDLIDFTTFNVITAIRPVHRDAAQRSVEIKGVIEVSDADSFTGSSHRIRTFA